MKDENKEVEPEKVAETVIVEAEAQVEDAKSAEDGKVPGKVGSEEEAPKAPEPVEFKPEAKDTTEDKKDDDDDTNLEGGEEDAQEAESADSQLPLIAESANTLRLIFRNVAKGSTVSDATLKQLSFIYVDLSLEIFKVNELSDQDAELQKRLEQEKSNHNTDEAKA
jgi:hypothetical protein